MQDARYGMKIEPVVSYVADQSDPSRQQFVFAYTIRITNVGTLAAKLVSRHWIITDGEHRVQEVRGEGVVGKQPTIAPGETFEYSSGASIATPVGTMRGSYRMVATDGCEFDAPIERFTLSVPRTLH
ncbi:MAG: Co2+/Mg2+ efflux protein ApaG [Betaproteobacteria bacterium PRO3]|nr:Co2+/Mg2+ efflux protein ApaG [Betaproteobacteria bacterium PRO3]